MEALNEKKKVLYEIYKYTEDISKALESQEIEKTVELFQHRQQLIEKLNYITQKIEENTGSSLKKLLEDRSKEDNQEVIDEIAFLLKKIKTLDDDNKIKMDLLKTSITEEITKIKQTGNAMKGYGIIGDRPSSEGAFIDMKR